MKTVITYGTFDLLHYGHIALLERAKKLAEGGRLIVGLSTDPFNALKGKNTYLPYAERKKLVEAIRYVDQIFPEENWEQKKLDIKKYDVDIFVIDEDWARKFDELKTLCNVIYLERTPTISSTAIKEIISETKQTN